MIRALYRRLSNLISDERKRASERLYYEDIRDIQYSIGRPLTGRELTCVWSMDDLQIYTIKTWLKEAKK